MQKKLAFTGHRPESLPFGDNENDPRCIRLKAMLLTEIMDRARAGYNTFYTGCARGMDIIFAGQVLRVKATAYPHIRLIGVVPHEGQANHWSEMWRERYFALLAQADDVATLSAHYFSGCYHARNRYMVDAADALLAVCREGASGGTQYTLGYARQKNCELVVIDPDTLERRLLPPRLTVL